MEKALIRYVKRLYEVRSSELEGGSEMHKPTGRSLQYNNEVNQQHRYPGIVISRKY